MTGAPASLLMATGGDVVSASTQLRLRAVEAEDGERDRELEAREQWVRGDRGVGAVPRSIVTSRGRRWR